MKAILAVVAVLLAVTHVGDTQGDPTPKPPLHFVSLWNDSNEEVSYNVKEGVNHTCVTLKAVGPNIQSAFDVTVVAKDGSATYPSDYAAREVKATFLPGETTANACIPIVDDEDHECLEWFTLELKLTQAAVDLSAVLSSPVTARVLVEDNDVVSIDFDSLKYDITEGNLGELNIFLDRRSQTNIQCIAMTMDGTADGSDYVGGNFPATIHAGMKNITIPLVTKADVLLESTEFLSVFIKPNAVPPNCSAVVAGPPANVSIIDGTVPVKFSASVYHVCTVRGRPSSVAIVLEAMKNHKFDFTVKVHIRDGTAKRNLDYDEEPVITVRFSNQQKIVTIPIAIVGGGEVAEPPENFTVELEIPEDTKSYGVVAVEPSIAKIVITDVQIGTFSPQNYTVREGEVTRLTIVLDRPSMHDTIFNVATMSLTATTFDDYFRHNYNVTVPAGAMEATTTVVTIRNSKIEAEEHFKAIVRPVVECNFEDNRESTAYITITDCTVLVKFSSAMYTVIEGRDHNVTVTVLANGAVDESDFTVRVIAKDDSATSGDDYVIKETLLLFKRGESEHSFSINITDDILAEPYELFTLELERPQQGSTVCIARGTPDITYVGLADDDVVTVSFSPQNYTVPEGIPAALWMVLDKVASESITVFVTTMDITAGSADYVQENGTPVTFAPGTTTAALFLLTLRDTVISEPNESLKVTLDLEPTTVRVEIGPDPCFVTIEDATVGVNFRSAMYMVGEGDGSVTVTVEASKEHADFEFVIKMVARDGTAEKVQVTFPAGKTTVDVSIGINDDEVAESDETFYLVLEIPEKATVNGVVAIPPNTTEIKIIDNDVVTVSFSPQNYTVSEGIAPPLRMVLDKEASESITVFVTTMDITAGSADYIQEMSKPVVFAPGTTRAALPLLTLRDTVINEPDESLKVTLDLGPTTVRVQVAPDPCFVTIVDATVGVKFHSAMYMVGEGDGSVTVTVEASKEHLIFDFRIKMVAKDATAQRESDLLRVPEAIPVTFPAGKTTVDITIGINDDLIAESLEIFHLVLEIPEKATHNGVVAVSPSTTEIKIIDNDDVTITFSPQNYTVTEGDPAPLMIILDKPAAKDITVTVTTMDITATDTDDYIGGSFEVSIPAGSVKVTLNVSTLQDNTVEPAEYFKATLSLLGAPEGCVVGTPNTSHITILDGTHYPQCSFRLCKRRRNALCTLPNAAGNCTFKVTACRAAYYSMDERPPPPKCSSRNKCAGLTGEPLEKCLKKWASCVKKAFKAQHGKTPDNLRKNAFFKGLEYPCGG